jgi:hypothetical protein
VLRERGLLGAWPVWLVDTAGDRDLAADEVEREGQARAGRARAAADLVLWLEPSSSAEARPPPRARSSCARSPTARARPRSPASDLRAARSAAARARIAEIFRRTFALPEDPWTREPRFRSRSGSRARSRTCADLGPALERRVEAILELDVCAARTPA